MRGKNTKELITVIKIKLINNLLVQIFILLIANQKACLKSKSKHILTKTNRGSQLAAPVIYLFLCIISSMRNAI